MGRCRRGGGVIADVKTRGREERYVVEPSDIRSHCSATSSSLSLPFRNASAGDQRRTEKATSHGLPTTLGTCQFTSCRRRPSRLGKRTRMRWMPRCKTRGSLHYESLGLHAATWLIIAYVSRDEIRSLCPRREKRKKALRGSFRATFLETGYAYLCLKALRFFT